MTNDLHVKSI